MLKKEIKSTPMKKSEFILRKGIFDRWYIGHAKQANAAWSGSRWVLCLNGEPTGGVQVCNFATEAEAREYCREHSSEFKKQYFDTGVKIIPGLEDGGWYQE